MVDCYVFERLCKLWLDIDGFEGSIGVGGCEDRVLRLGCWFVWFFGGCGWFCS